MTVQSWCSGVLTGLFNVVNGRGAVHEKDQSHIFSTKLTMDKFVYGNDGYLVNFQYILETGKIPAKQLFGSTALGDGISYIPDMLLKTTCGTQHIKWNSDDAFIKALGSIRTNTMVRIEDTSLLQDLLQKEEWDREDRLLWEQKISEIIAEEVDRIPGLGEYRTTSRIAYARSAKERPICLNKLSSDIENNTMDIEFDCEAMTAVEGIMLQQMDNIYLPAKASDGNLKAIYNYFYVSGAVEYASNMKGRHAFIQSSATGSIIEATNKDPGDHYFEIFNHSGYGIENMRRGEEAYTRNAVYGGINILSR